MKKQIDLINASNPKTESKTEINPTLLKVWISLYGKADAYKIANHKVEIGMRDKVVSASLGTPSLINRTETAHGFSEQWVYDNHYLYFINGKLTTIQTTIK